MRLLFIFLSLFIFISNVFAGELYVSYLKPVSTKGSKTVKTKRRDPTSEPITVFKPLKPDIDEKFFDLQAILYNPESKKAYINDELYLENDKIDGYTLKKITTDTVILEKGSREIKLKLE